MGGILILKYQIPQKVRELCRRFETRNPFQIAKELGITVWFEPLGSIRGYCNQVDGIRFIHINENLSGDEQIKVCAHELGHHIIHPDTNSPYLKGHTYLSVNRLEREANCFMVCLLISDDELLENEEMPMSFFADVWGLPLELVEWRYQQIGLEWKGT